MRGGAAGGGWRSGRQGRNHGSHAKPQQRSPQRTMQQLGAAVGTAWTAADAHCRRPPVCCAMLLPTALGQGLRRSGKLHGFWLCSMALSSAGCIHVLLPEPHMLFTIATASVAPLLPAGWTPPLALRTTLWWCPLSLASALWGWQTRMTTHWWVQAGAGQPQRDAEGWRSMHAHIPGQLLAATHLQLQTSSSSSSTAGDTGSSCPRGHVLLPARRPPPAHPRARAPPPPPPPPPPFCPARCGGA